MVAPGSSGSILCESLLTTQHRLPILTHPASGQLRDRTGRNVHGVSSASLPVWPCGRHNISELRRQGSHSAARNAPTLFMARQSPWAISSPSSLLRRGMSLAALPEMMETYGRDLIFLIGGGCSSTDRTWWRIAGTSGGWWRSLNKAGISDTGSITTAAAPHTGKIKKNLGSRKYVELYKFYPCVPTRTTPPFFPSP